MLELCSPEGNTADYQIDKREKHTASEQLKYCVNKVSASTLLINVAVKVQRLRIF